MLYALGISALGFTLNAPLAAQSVARSSEPLMREFRIAPSILSADFARLGEEVENVLAAALMLSTSTSWTTTTCSTSPSARWSARPSRAVRAVLSSRTFFAAYISFYSLTFKPFPLADGIKAPIDVHLMVTPVDGMIGDFADAGADFITFHPEATTHIDRSLSLIRGAGCKSGLVFNPSTPLDCLKYVMDKVDIILCTHQPLEYLLFLATPTHFHAILLCTQ